MTTSPTAQVETSEGTTSTVEPKGSAGGLPRASTTPPPARRPPSRPRGRSTSTSTGSAATSARTARAPAPPRRAGARRRGAASRSTTPSSTSGTATRRAATRSPARPTFAARRSRTATASSSSRRCTRAGIPGRTVHIHAKVHLDKQTVLTTQFYFDDAFNAQVFEGLPTPPAPAATPSTTRRLYDSDLELTLSDEATATRADHARRGERLTTADPAGIPCASESVASARYSRLRCLCSLGAGVDGREASPPAYSFPGDKTK